MGAKRAWESLGGDKALEDKEGLRRGRKGMVEGSTRATWEHRFAGD